MNQPKYRLAHEYLISRIRLRSGEVETPVQKYDRLLSSRAQAWKNENHDRRHLLRWKEIYYVHKLKAHLNWQQDAILKKDFFRKSAARRLTVFGSAFFITILLIGSIGFYITKSQEQRDFDVILTALQYKGKDDINKIRTELLLLSSKSLTFKTKVLSAVLQDTSDRYKEELMPCLSHALFGISRNNREKLLEYFLKNISANNVLKFYNLFFSKNADSLMQNKMIHALIDLLQKNKDHNFQLRVINAVGQIGCVATRDVVPLLFEQLQKTNDPQIQQAVASALVRIGRVTTQDVVPFLIDLLQRTEDPQLQLNVVDALGEIGPPAASAVQPLIERLQKTKDFGSRWHVTESLRKIGPAIAVPFLIKLLIEKESFASQNPDAFNYALAPDALAAFDKIGPAAVPAVQPLIDLLRKTKVPYFQKSVAYALGQIGPVAAPAVQPLIDLLQKTKDPDVQRSVVGALGGIGQAAAPAIQPLIKLLQETKRPDIQESVALALMTIGPTVPSDAVYPLVDLLQKNIGSMLFVTSALGKIGQADQKHVVPILVNLLLKTEDFEIQKNVASALGEIGPAAAPAVQPLLNLLQKNKDPYVQQRMAFALGAIGAAAVPAVPSLLDLLSKVGLVDLRRAVSDALVKIGKTSIQEVIPPLIELLQKPEGKNSDYRIQSLKTDIAGILGELGHKKAQIVVPLLIELLQKDETPWVQQSVTEALKKIALAATSEVVPLLVDLLQKTNNSKVHYYVVSILGTIGTAAAPAVHPLMDLLRQTKDYYIQKSVADALGNVGPRAEQALTELNRAFHASYYSEMKFSTAAAMLKIDPANDEHLKNMIEIVLPHAVVGYEHKEDIIKLVGKAAGKEAAGENLDFDGDMWKMIEWWEKRKKG